jgi:Plavaka transposase
MQKINWLPTGPDWICDIVNVSGDLEGEDGERMGEELELWRHNPLECIQDLIGNPSFKNEMVYESAQFFTDRACSNRLIDEAWTADWWWKVQVSSRLPLMAVSKKKKSATRKKSQREAL